MINKKDLLAKCLTQTAIFKSSLGDIKLRQLTIAESEEIGNIQKDETKTLRDVMFYTLRKSMVEPEFFTDEELAQLGIKGQEFIYEVFNEIPLIGMSEKDREKYNEKIKKFLESKKEETDEEIEKK